MDVFEAVSAHKKAIMTERDAQRQLAQAKSTLDVMRTRYDEAYLEHARSMRQLEQLLSEEAKRELEARVSPQSSGPDTQPEAERPGRCSLCG